MIEIIPAIDLLGGKCVRLLQGDYKKVTEFNENPIEQALRWVSQGAESLHLVDLDGAKTGKPLNDLIIKEIRSQIDIPIQIGGGVRNMKRAEDLIKLGINRVILGTIAIEEPIIIEKLAKKYPKKIVIGIDAKDGKVATRGWQNRSETKAIDLIERFSDKGIGAFICTDIATDGTLKGPNIPFLSEMATRSEVPLIASGGIGNLGDILSILPLEEKGISGIILGRALYDGTVDLSEAIRITKNSNVKDITNINQNFA